MGLFFSNVGATNQVNDADNGYHTLDISSGTEDRTVDRRRCPPSGGVLNRVPGVVRDVLAFPAVQWAGAIVAGMGTAPFHPYHLAGGLGLLTVGLGATCLRVRENNWTPGKMDCCALPVTAMAYSLSLLVSVMSHESTTPWR
jgi:hypothetical protein